MHALLDAIIGPRERLVLQPVGLHDPAPVQHLGKRRRELAGLDHALDGGLLRRATERARHPGDDRKRKHRDQRQTPVLIEHDRAQKQKRQAFLGDPGNAPHDGVAQQVAS